MLIELILKNTGDQVVINARQITTLKAIELGCRVSIGPFYSIDVVEQPELVIGMWQAALRSERVSQFAVALMTTEWAGKCGEGKLWQMAADMANAEPPANP
jgi:hypothetical protein